MLVIHWGSVYRESSTVSIEVSELLQLQHELSGDGLIPRLGMISAANEQVLHLIRIFFKIKKLPLIDSVVADELVPLGANSIVRFHPMRVAKLVVVIVNRLPPICRLLSRK
jgi:hypothetical protein